MDNKTKSRYGLAIFFILCGLIVGVSLSTFMFTWKDYEGVIPITDNSASILLEMYPRWSPPYESVAFPYTTKDGVESVAYHLYTYKNWDLPYKVHTEYLWFPIVFSILHIGLGTYILLNKEAAFAKNGHGINK